MELRMCWDWVQSLDLSLNWSQPIDFLSSTLYPDERKERVYFWREWASRSRESTDLAITSWTSSGQKHTSHCHRNVLEAVVKNLKKFRESSKGQEVQMMGVKKGEFTVRSFDSDLVENMLRIIYKGEFASVSSIAKNHFAFLDFVEDLKLLKDRQKVSHHFIRSEFHRICVDDSFLSLKPAEITRYIQSDLLPLGTMADVLLILKSLISWAHKHQDFTTFIRLLSQLSTTLVSVHGRVKLTNKTVNNYREEIQRRLQCEVISHQEPYSRQNSCSPVCSRRLQKSGGKDNVPKYEDVLTLACDDGVEIHCLKRELCRIAYFDMMLNAGFKESYETRIELNEIGSNIIQLIVDFVRGEPARFDLETVAEAFTTFDYMQCDQLLCDLERFLRVEFLELSRNTYSASSYSQFVKNSSLELIDKMLPLFLKDVHCVFGMNGLPLVIDFLLEWLGSDETKQRQKFIPMILEHAIEALYLHDNSVKKHYETFNKKLTMFDGQKWRICHWGNLDSLREGIYNYHVLEYKGKILCNNWNRNSIEVVDSISADSSAVTILKHPQDGKHAVGYFCEMLGRIFCSVGAKHYILNCDDIHNVKEVSLPMLNGGVLLPRCVDTKLRRIYFDTDDVLLGVHVDDEFNITSIGEWDSRKIAIDHHLHILNGALYALKLNHPCYVLDEAEGAFVLVDLPLANSILPRVEGVIEKIFDLNGSTYLIVNEAVKITQVRVRCSLDESDPRVCGFFKWSPEDSAWKDVAQETAFPLNRQITQKVSFSDPRLYMTESHFSSAQFFGY